MKKYSVVIHYSVEVEADSEYRAQDRAWFLLGEANPLFNDDFSCTVEEVE